MTRTADKGQIGKIISAKGHNNNILMSISKPHNVLLIQDITM